jgi:hypothetical protein
MSKQRLVRVVNWAGMALFGVGIGLFFVEGKHFQSMVNYQRLALLLPLVYSIPMLHIDTLADWSKASTTDRIRAAGTIVVAVLLTGGVLFWLIVDPDARATS